MPNPVLPSEVDRKLFNMLLDSTATTITLGNIVLKLIEFLPKAAADDATIDLYKAYVESQTNGVKAMREFMASLKSDEPK